MTRRVLPDLATKQDLQALAQRLEHRLIAEMNAAKRRALGIIAAMLVILYALLELIE